MSLTLISIALFVTPLLQGPQLLPAFDVQSVDGVESPSAALARDGRWVLVYVQPRCRPCDSLLSLLKKEDLPRPERVVILVGGSLEEAKALSSRFPELAAASWYVDKAGGFESLKLTGVPIVLGLQESRIGWRLAGVLPKSSDMRSIVLSWIEEIRAK